MLREIILRISVK